MSLLDQIERYEGYTPLDFAESVARRPAANWIARRFGWEYDHVGTYDSHRVQ